MANACANLLYDKFASESASEHSALILSLSDSKKKLRLFKVTHVPHTPAIHIGVQKLLKLKVQFQTMQALIKLVQSHDDLRDQPRNPRIVYQQCSDILVVLEELTQFYIKYRDIAVNEQLEAALNQPDPEDVTTQQTTTPLPHATFAATATNKALVWPS